MHGLLIATIERLRRSGKKKKRNREYIKIILSTALPPLFFCLFVSKVKQNDYSQENVDEIGGIFPPI